MPLSQRSATELARAIHAVNHGWKTSRDRFGKDDSLAQGLRRLKTRLQVQFLRHPEVRVQLRLDPTAGHEAVYSIDILEGTGGQYTNAAHIPHRVLKQYMEDTELAQFQQAESTFSSS